MIPREKQYKYYAFISYSRKNSKAAVYLHRQLEHFRIPIRYVAEEKRPDNQKFLRPIFRDRRDLENGEGSFTEDIKSALEQSRYLIVLCSPDSAASSWVNKEIRHFLAVNDHDLRTVVPVILEGTPRSGDSRECLPEALRLEEIIMRNLPSMIPDDGDSERIGWENGVVQAMSYMLKVNREKIKASVDAEKVRQAKLLTFIAVVTTIIFGLLAAWAVNAELKAKAYAQKAKEEAVLAEKRKQEAEHHRALAVKRELLAKEQAELASKSMAFLRDLLKSSDPAKGGKNKITVLEAVKSKIPELKKCEPWQLKVNVSREIASLLDNLGEYEEALAVIREAAALSKEKQPLHEQTAAVLNVYAFILLSNRNYPEALKIFSEALRIYGSTPEKYPAERARVCNNIAVTYTYMGKYKEALFYNQQSLKLRIRQVDQPLELANTYYSSGFIYHALKDYKNALASHLKALAIKRKHTPAQSLTMAASLYFTGVCFYHTGELSKALEYLREAYGIAQLKLGKKHPTTIQYRSVYNSFSSRR
jgi:tetratricopeptide (TPR) repeat protein